jgi:hypothetical protein
MPRRKTSENAAVEAKSSMSQQIRNMEKAMAKMDVESRK